MTIKIEVTRNEVSHAGESYGIGDRLPFIESVFSNAGAEMVEALNLIAAHGANISITDILPRQRKKPPVIDAV